MDAREFYGYDAYDILFMFNPFDNDIYADVMKRIEVQIQNSKVSKTRLLICYGGANIDAVKKSGMFSLIREDRCPFRGNVFRVFKSRHYV